MLLKPLTTVATLGLVAMQPVVAVEKSPYKPTMKMSLKPMFGLRVRQAAAGYHPEQAFCGDGNTCAEACGTSYAECASSGTAVHCFNPQAQETCCPGNGGNSCDAGYYCASDQKNETWCCPDSMDLSACAAAFGVAGGLVPQSTGSAVVSAAPTPSDDVMMSYEPVPVSTKAPSAGLVTTTIQVFAHNSTTIVMAGTAPLPTTPSSPAATASAHPLSNSVPSQATVAPASPTTSHVVANEAMVSGPAHLLNAMAFAGAALAML